MISFSPIGVAFLMTEDNLDLFRLSEKGKHSAR